MIDPTLLLFFELTKCPGVQQQLWLAGRVLIDSVAVLKTMLFGARGCSERVPDGVCVDGSSCNRLFMPLLVISF